MKRFDLRWTAILTPLWILAGCGGHVPVVGETPDGGGPAPTPDSGPPTPDTGPPTPDTGPPTPDTGPPPPPPPDCVAQLPDDIRARFIAFDSDREDFARQIYMMHPDGSSLTRVLSDAFTDKEPSFSTDGTRIAFTSDRDGATQIYVVELATQKVTKVTNRPEGADQPSFSRDGKTIAFHSGKSIYVISETGDGESIVASGLDDFNAYFWPHFSADDSELVFDRNNEINAVKISGMGLRQIVQNWTTTIKAPAVSPDGREVAYHVYCESPGASIWTTPFATKTDPCKGRRVTPPSEFVSERPAWATTTLLAYELVNKATNVASIAVISRAAGSTPCVLTSDGSDHRNPSWSP